MSTAPSLPEFKPDRPGTPAPLKPEPVEPRRKKSSRKTMWLVLGAAALATAAWQWSGSSFDGGGTTAVGVETVAATRGELKRTLRVGGTIVARKFAPIRAPQIRRGARVGGGGGFGLTLVSMAPAGSMVKAGSIVAEFDRQSQEQTIDNQRANVVQAESSIDYQRANLMIEMEALKQQLVTAQGDFHKAELDLRTAAVKSEIEAQLLQAQMEESKATAEELESEIAKLEKSHAARLRQVELDRDMQQLDLQRAEINSDRLAIRTPIAGIVVLETSFRGGSFAQTSVGDQVNSGALFMQVVDPSDMVLQTQVNQADIHLLRVGQAAEIRLDAYPGRVWKGRVESVAAMAGGGSDMPGRGRGGSGNYVRSVAVAVNILDSDPVIIPDLSASADVVLETQEDVLLAPREALSQIGEDWYVWLMGGPTPERRAVEVSSWTDTQVAVSAGLKEGDKLAIGDVQAEKEK
jgi:multidrug efflux pump subunit AcrA (membrane-fusion protein)